MIQIRRIWSWATMRDCDEYEVFLCHGADDAIAAIKEYLGIVE